MIIKEEAVNNKEVSVETQKELDKEGWKWGEYNTHYKIHKTRKFN